MLDVAQGDLAYVVLQRRFKAFMECVHLLLNDGVQDGLLQVCGQAAFCEVHQGKGVKSKTTGGPKCMARLLQGSTPV